jgi:sialic acid synthase SpsE
VPIAAVAAGATLLEKHITLDRTLPGPDHAASMEPQPFTQLVHAVRTIEQALGDGVKRVQPCELDAQRVARKSLFVARPLARGQRIGEADLTARRPGTGISPSRQRSLVGRSASRDLAAGEMLREGDFE